MPRPDRSLRIPAACNACGRLFVSISGQKLLGHRVQVFRNYSADSRCTVAGSGPRSTTPEVNLFTGVAWL